jgi:hypothetical protein
MSQSLSSASRRIRTAQLRTRIAGSMSGLPLKHPSGLGLFWPNLYAITAYMPG